MLSNDNIRNKCEEILIYRNMSEETKSALYEVLMIYHKEKPYSIPNSRLLEVSNYGYDLFNSKINTIWKYGHQSKIEELNDKQYENLSSLILALSEAVDKQTSNFDKNGDSCIEAAKLYISAFHLMVGNESNLDKAKYYIQKALQLSPENKHVHLLAGVLAQQTGHHSEAIKYLEKAKSLGASSAFIPLALSYVQVEGDTNKAKIIMEEYKIKNPNETQRIEELLNFFASNLQPKK